MASRFGGSEVRSLAGFEESGPGLNNRRIQRPEPFETLDGEVRVLDEAKILVNVTNKAIESLNDGYTKKEFEGIDTCQVTEMMAWNNDFMLDMISRDLDEKYGNGWENGPEINLIENFKLWRETVGKATNKREIHIDGSVDQGCSNSVNLACPREVENLRGSQDSNTSQMLPSLKSLPNTFSPNEVLDFLELAARQPRRVGELFVAKKQAELTVHNKWNRKRKHSSSAIPSICD